jgi:F-type H+-transporting ATPase subunit b
VHSRLRRYRRAPQAALLCAALALAALSPALAFAQTHEPASVAAADPAAEHGEAAGHEEGWTSTVAKVVNFAALAGILVYFLRTPIVDYLRSRHASIRKDLVDAKTIRAQAESELHTVRSRLAELPAELDALRARGRDELAQERVRLQQATTRERDHLRERTRRDIDLQARTARRALTLHAAELTTQLARTRIEQAMTAQDQARLVERYTADVQS